MNDQQKIVAQKYLEKLHSLRTWKKGDVARPHKLVLILSIIELLEKDVDHKNNFSFVEIEPLFDFTWNKYKDIIDSDLGLLEYPYYHLTSDGFWHHKVKSEAETLYQKYRDSKVVHYRFTKNRILETIEYAYLDDELYELLRNAEIRTLFATQIQIQLKSLEKAEKDTESKSIFWHENIALEAIGSEVKRYALGHIISNLLIYDNQTNDYYECDLIIISPQGIYLVELKHWSGKIRIAPYNWIKDDVVYRQDPHRANLFKAKILKGIYQHQFRTFPDIWVESVVVLTNPEAEVEGASPSKTEKHCPSFGSIDTFIDFLKHQRRAKEEKLDHLKIERVGHYLESLQHSKREKGHVFPGFEIIERLTERPDLVEYVVRPKEGKIRRSQRFRVFLPPQGSNVHEKERFLSTRQKYLGRNCQDW